jgi:hypothetical protein
MKREIRVRPQRHTTINVARFAGALVALAMAQKAADQAQQNMKPSETVVKRRAE